MKRVLITAYEPYDVWNSNASWDALVELTKDLPTQPSVTTRLYPVDYELMQERIWKDLEANYDVAIHLGQAPGTTCIQLESIAVNVATKKVQSSPLTKLVEDGPVAYQTSLPVDRYLQVLRAAEIPSQISLHAGSYLCNAVFYMSQHIAVRQKLKTESIFVHVPSSTKQAAQTVDGPPSMSSAMCAQALGLILAEIESISG